MNEITKMLLWIYYLGTISVVATMFAVVLFLTAILLFAFAMNIAVEAEKQNVKEPKEVNTCIKLSAVSIILCVVCVIVSVAIPDQATLKLVAISEVSGKLLNTKSGQQVVNDALNTSHNTSEMLELLKKYLEKETNDTK